MIVINTPVLSNLAAANRLEILRELFGEVLVPSSVYEEILKGIESGYMFLARIDEALEREHWLSLAHLTGESRRTFKTLLNVFLRLPLKRAGFQSRRPMRCCIGWLRGDIVHLSDPLGKSLREGDTRYRRRGKYLVPRPTISP